ncbi:hypothetical protein AB0B92_40910 [Streptomyces hygroscopicus]|uniref:hypothetical protein n=1 Tax=Streptomyces TaxID=1883 RepID=UPI00209DCA6A|nr:hypothetical protein [Streptomyces sp. RKCA744]MCO8301670.1 hypothetical protein [Streptomyces sp. RKCA744]
MSFFRRKNEDDPNEVESYERAKREGSELRQIAYTHSIVDNNRPDPDKPRGSVGPSCDTASTPRRGRRW